MRGIRDWIASTRRKLLEDNYTNRSKLQKQLMVLQDVENRLYERNLKYQNEKMRG